MVVFADTADVLDLLVRNDSRRSNVADGEDARLIPELRKS